MLQHPAEVKDYFAGHRAELRGMLQHAAESGLELVQRNAQIADRLLTTLFPAAAAALPELTQPVVFAAVGGYGRRQLGLRSDLDVRFVTFEQPERLAPLVEALLYPLWDAGINIGHQVLAVDDALAAAQSDLATATALLDCRPIAGDLSVSSALQERAFRELFAENRISDFLSRLRSEVEERHRRFGDSLYLLEPDVKNGAGGLRDADVAWWSARARYHVKGWPELLGLGVLTSGEARAPHEAIDFLWRVRNHLHIDARRRNDRLTFEHQEQLALDMDYRAQIGARAGASDEQLLGPIVEAFMSDYYRNARAITRARERIMERALPRVRRGPVLEREIGEGLCSVDGAIAFSKGVSLAGEPALALRLYSTALAQHAPVLPAARDAIARAVSEDPHFSASLRELPEASARFVSLLCTARTTPFRNGSILGELHDVGLLVALIPEFAPVVGRVHHDLYHVYTVDVHSVAAVERLRALVRGELMSVHPLACRLAAEITRPEVIFFATLLHDIGKVFGGREHSERGAEMARSILARFNLAEDDIAQVCHLILHHLTMYFVAARRDLSDPATIAAFARDVGEREALRDLYLLTVADLSTTAPASMTSWKANMLDELFVATHALLAGNASSEPARLERIRAQVSECWDARLERGFLHEYLATMPDRYLLSNTPAEIAAHAQVALSARNAQFYMRLVPSRHPEVAELCVVSGARLAADTDGAGLCVIAGDRPGLLAAIGAALTATRLEVHAAQIYNRTSADGGVQAVDVFWVRDRTEGVEGVRRALPKLERDLRALVEGALTIGDLVQQRRPSRWSERPTPPVPSEVSIDNRSSRHHSIIEVIAQDRPGLLFTLANALYELRLNIAVAKVNTEGNRIVDVFYVTELDDTKISSPERSEAVRLNLLSVLRKPRETN